HVKEAYDCWKELTGEVSPNIYSVGCGVIESVLECAFLAHKEFSPCTKAVFSTACGAVEGGFVGAVLGGGGDIIECLCTLPGLPLPPFGGGGWAASGGAVGFNTVSPPCESGGFASAKVLRSGPTLNAPQGPAAPSQGICARVRLEIDQDVVMSRSAFKGTL